MKYQLQLILSNQPAVLERVLQTTRYRGFKLDSLNLQAVKADTLELSMTVCSQQSVSLLTTQLNKLYDLVSIKFEELLPLKTSA